MQKLINLPIDTVAESLQGLELAHEKILRVSHKSRFVYRADAPVHGKVAIVSGSGSGHEPLNVGYVGRGMLDAACLGDVFTSPTPMQYLAATEMVEGGAGVLYVVKNHTGGVLNMEIAMEMAAEREIMVKTVLVNDDVAVDDAANRRGLGAAIFVEKIAGAAAERGYTLNQVQAVAKRSSTQCRSMGVALTSCILPNLGRPTFDLPADEMEIGVGIHGERGRQRIPSTSADQVVELLLEPIMADLEVRAGDRMLVMVSGLGGTPQQELYIVYRHLHKLLTMRGVTIEQQLIGNYITSLEMAGCAVTLMRVDAELLELWNAPVHTPTLWW
ncbi:MAG: dihydroxyacetone kinase subunit DhaK [Caldilineaceae bacterium]|nr:dihydroxyacetone kinase subunit DhaK [Caldilineaceae bacterium]